jgi:DeoR/GlpR family transcriptional regulator of sugar metabolism
LVTAQKIVKTEPRRQQILKLLEETGTINVNELAERFQVSLVTIRNDLDDLEKEGLLQRTFGGAVFSHRTRFNKSFRERIQQQRDEKRAVAIAALGYIKERAMSVFVITCSVPAALELSSGGYDILLLGGIVRNKSLALLGRETLTILERYRADKAFLGSSGFTAKRGHSTPNPEDAQIKEAIMRAADETYVLVDSSKYGHDCLTSFARLRDVDLTITDSHLSRQKAAILEAAGARLCIVDLAKANLDREAAGSKAEQTLSRDKGKPLDRRRRQ